MYRIVKVVAGVVHTVVLFIALHLAFAVQAYPSVESESVAGDISLNESAAENADKDAQMELRRKLMEGQIHDFEAWRASEITGADYTRELWWYVNYSKYQWPWFDPWDCNSVDTITSASLILAEYNGGFYFICIGDSAVWIDGNMLEEYQDSLTTDCSYSLVGLDHELCRTSHLEIRDNDVIPALTDSIRAPCNDIEITYPHTCDTIVAGNDLIVNWTAYNESQVMIILYDSTMAINGIGALGVPDTGSFVIPSDWFDLLPIGPIGIGVSRFVVEEDTIQGLPVNAVVHVRHVVGLVLVEAEDQPPYSENLGVTLDSVSGLSAPGALKPGTDITFWIGFHNNAVDTTLRGFTNGFRIYSLDGVVWTDVRGDSVAGAGMDLFDLIFQISSFGVTGAFADTVGFGGAVMSNLAVSAPYNQTALRIDIGPIDGSLGGGTICLDSCFFPPSGSWMWAVRPGGGSGRPLWDGPHCWVVDDRYVYIISEPLPAILFGTHFEHQFNAYGGEPPYAWSLADGVIPLGMTIDGDGLLSGVPEEAGSFTFTVRVEDAETLFAEETYTLDVYVTFPPPDIVIEKWGTTAVPGRVLEYTISVSNVGNIPALDLEVLEILDPRLFALIDVDPPGVTSIDTLADASLALWSIDLEPFQSTMLHYKAQLYASTPLGTTVTGTACTGIELADVYASCLKKLALTLTSCVCAVATCGAIGPGCGSILACWPTIVACGKCLGLDAGISGPSGCLVDAYQLGECIGEILECYSHEEIARQPVDPNEKGVLANRFVQSDHVLTYPIHFENVGDVEALDVFVTDTLEPNLDFSTIELLTPGGALIPESRTIKWEFVGINLQPGETGEVLFSVRPIPGLPSGTEIRNSAIIGFEIFDSVTNEVVNIIDDVKPEGIMSPLPEVTIGAEFSISWQGGDSVGQVDFYTIFVSVDSGGFTELIHRTTDESYLFNGEAGHAYDFICIATDVAGNTEIQEPVSEAGTLVEGPTGVGDEPDDILPRSYSLSQNYPNPFNASTIIRYDLPKVSDVTITVFNILGQSVVSLVNILQPPGSYEVVWNGTNESGESVASGVYLYRIEAGEFVASKKMLLLK